MTNVLIVGAGQLGSRYLQGLAKIEKPLNITLVDQAEDSLILAKNRYDEVIDGETDHKLTCAQCIPDSLSAIDLAIVATPSRGRSDLVSEIAKCLKVRYWVIEKVLAQSSVELLKIKQAVAQARGCWVNTPRRMMAWHQRIRSSLRRQSPLKVEQVGGLWGLACNSIHYIDLVAWWTGEAVTSLSTDGLDKTWFESKRTGYYEVTGELVVHYSGGSVLRLDARVDAASQGIRVEILAGEVWVIDEQRGLATGPTGLEINGQIEYQSLMTPRLVMDILEKENCALPTLEESSAMHEVFLGGMLDHWNQSHNRNDSIVPIT